MGTPDPQDLPSRLHAESDAPQVTPGFFDSLAFSASLSTPSAGVGLAARMGRTKVAAAIGTTAVLISGAAYAGGLMGGGDDRDAVPLTPAHTSSSTDKGSDESTPVDEPRSLEPKANHGKGDGKGQGDGTKGSTGTGPDPGTDSDGDDKPWWADGRHHCDGPDGRPWWDDDDDWGNRSFSWGDHNDDGDWGDRDRGCGWGWGDHDGDWGDHDGDWGDHDGGGDNDGDWDGDWDGDHDGGWNGGDGDWNGHDGDNWGDGSRRS